MIKKLKNFFNLILSWNTLNGLCVFLVKFLPVFLYVKVFGKRESCWLFTERSGDARDNGYVLYKWLYDNHPEYKIAYAIDFKSQDYVNVKGMGVILNYGSYRHWYYYFASTACCGTTWTCCCPNGMVFLMTRHLMPTKSKRVFLQHGITKDFMPEMTYRKLVADILVCGAYPEWEYIKEYFGYPAGHVKYLGFSRFDRLIDTSKKAQIWYMPTWRKWVANEKGFEDSEYYRKIASLLSSSRLKVFLEANNVEFVYFTHPSIRDLKSHFSKFGSEHIRVLNNEEMDLQKLICSANMLITDYSSIYFDFAYQNKPVLYYHFDYERYRKSHFTEGYFNYQNDGFGPIYLTEDELINAILTVYHSNWLLPVEYAQRRDRFFPMKDRNNCKRHFDSLCEIERSFLKDRNNY